MGKQKIDPEMQEFEEALLRSIDQANNGDVRVTTPEQILVRQARDKAGLTQPEFADLIATPVSTLRDWEQGRFKPSGGVMCLLKLIIKNPALASELQTV